MIVYKIVTKEDGGYHSLMAGRHDRCLHYKMDETTYGFPLAPIFCYRTLKDLAEAWGVVDSRFDVIIKCQAKVYKGDLLDEIKHVVATDDSCKNVVFCEWIKPIKEVKK